jgi:uncharacterized phage protein (predicted DNA packaging)
MIDLQDIKQHLQIEHNLDDYILLTYLEAATEAVKTHCNVGSLDDLCDENGELRPSIRQAILLLTGNFYQNREIVSFGVPTELPKGFEYLIDLNKKYYNQ